MNLARRFVETAAREGSRTAIVEGSGARISFADLAARSTALANAWRARGIGPGDRVLVAMGLGIGLYATIAALWRLGAVVVFPEPAMGRAGVAHAVAATQPKAFAGAGLYRALPFLVPSLWRVPLWLSQDEREGGDILEDVDEDHPALISFTSGSTGAPKGIVRSHGFLRAQDAALAPLLKPTRSDETDLVAFPVFVVPNLAFGVTSVLPCWKPTRHAPARAPDMLAQIERERVTRALLPPSVCEVLADGPADPGLAHLMTGGGPVFPDLCRRLMSRMPETRITAVYGSTEAEPIAHWEVRPTPEADWQAMREGAGLLAGPPVPETRVRIVDGEIVVTGEHVNKGYLDPRRDGEKLREAGEVWHRTGDAGQIDEVGRLWLLGRHEVGGARPPFPVEVAARSWPGVKRAAFVPKLDTVALEGREPSPGTWNALAGELGIRAMRVHRIPLDRRHRSKVDLPALSALMEGTRRDD